MPKKALNASIPAVTINKETLKLTIPITGYTGEPLYITSLTPVATANGNLLLVTIDNDGPPAASTVPAVASAKVQFAVSYKKSPLMTTPFTTNEVRFSNKPLVLTGIPTPNPLLGDETWNNSALTINVEEWRNAAADTGVTYVIRHDTGTPSGQLWWLINPDDTHIDDPAKKSTSFIDEPLGGGVHGPFGIDTP